MRVNRFAIAILLGGSVALLGACEERTVDTKRELGVPGTSSTCYFLEVEDSSGADDAGEEQFCAPKDVWDRNREDAVYVDRNGVPIK